MRIDDRELFICLDDRSKRSVTYKFSRIFRIWRRETALPVLLSLFRSFNNVSDRFNLILSENSCIDHHWNDREGDIKYWPGITTVSTGILLSLWTLFCCLCFSQCRKCFRNAPFVSTDSRVRQRWHGVLVSHTTPLWSLICLKHLTCPKDQFTLHISLSHSLSEHPLLQSS